MAFRFSPRELFERLQGLAKEPERTWQEIAEEPVYDLWDLFPVAAVLAAIAPLASILGGLIFFGLGGFLTRLLLAPLAWGILVVSAGVVAYGVFTFAPHLSSRANFLAAVKLVIWGLAAYWIALVGGLLPWAFAQLIFRLAGVAGTCYLWYFGFPVLLGTPRQPINLLAIFVLGAGFSYGTLIYLLDTLFLFTLLGPKLEALFG